MSVLYCIPFLGLLLSIAIFPLINGRLWEKIQPWVMIFWCLCFLIPYGAKYGLSVAAESTLESIVGDYITFIVLLFGLFTVAGNITIDGDLAGAPRTNCVLLFIGMLLSSVIGTTGASMLMIRPLIKMNTWRKNKAHIMVFFIFLVSNMGGCLTPIGDPPLLMGFSRGINFFYSLSFSHILLFNAILLLCIFYLTDRHFFRKEVAEGARPDISKPGNNISIKGLHNLIFIALIISAVILSGILPSVEPFAKGLHIYGSVVFTYTQMIEIVIILLSALGAYLTTPAVIREANHFTWGAITEVAILFIGIFITMHPALVILRDAGKSLKLSSPYQMFWSTGLLSSFLDNTPTYLVFLTTAGSLGSQTGVYTSLGLVPAQMLTAISCGAVFMGANSYIGNAPNMMVKAISEENGIKMPGFFGYIFWAIKILIPIFIIDTFVFFL